MTTQWTDSPITTWKADAFGRAAYAANAAQLIDASHSWDDSVVFGLTGPWGSGKTSMVAMICESLKTLRPQNDQCEWAIAPFTPWATSDVDGLLGDFFASLTDALPDDKAAKARTALGGLMQIVAPAFEAIPVVGSAAAELTKAVGSRIGQQDSWAKAFKATSDRLRELRTPILVVADDIDRLQTDELLLLLKVVRLLGRFPGVHYLLAYDDATLFRALRHANLVGNDDGAAGRYMEKIVQYPLVVPPLLQTQLLDRLNAGLVDVLRGAGRTTDPSPRLHRLLPAFRSLLSTPRAVDRYLAQLRHHLPLVPEAEVNDEDVIILTLLRTAFPEMYSSLPSWRDELLRGHTDILVGSGQGTGPGDMFERFAVEDKLIAKAPLEFRSTAKTLLEDLFPKLRERSISDLTYETKKQISDAAYFDRYFAMGVPAHDVSDVAVKDAIEAACRRKPKLLRDLLTVDDTGRAELAISKAMDQSRLLLGPNRRADVWPLLAAVLPVTSLVTGARAMLLDPHARVVSWAGILLAQLPDETSPQSVLDLLNTVPDLTTRLLIANELRDPLPEWWPQVAQDLAAQATEGLLGNLRLCDNATDDHRMPIYFLSSQEIDLEPTRDALLGACAAKEFTPEDVASRFVYSEPTGRHIFNSTQFAKLVPNIDDDSYPSTSNTSEDSDDSWSSRRAFASRQLSPPIEMDADL